MVCKESSTSRSRIYADGPPWVFTGSDITVSETALYQLHLVKAEVAKRFIPPELKLVQAFGYTLGGLYLAHYDSSPAGVFDESFGSLTAVQLVVLAGIVWNPPTSCAWAARVLVNSEEACEHGIKEVGLPSRTADFALQFCTAENQPRNPLRHIFPKKTLGKGDPKLGGRTLGVDIIEIDASSRRPLCHLELLNNSVMGPKQHGWSGPTIHMSLPSFSGKTKEQQELLKYTCSLTCRVRPVTPARVSSLQENLEDQAESSDPNIDILSVLTGKPIMAMTFEKLVMRVDAPMVVTAKASSREPEKNLGSSVPAVPVETS